MAISDRKRGIAESLKSDGVSMNCFGRSEYILFYMVKIYSNISSKLNINI